MFPEGLLGKVSHKLIVGLAYNRKSCAQHDPLLEIILLDGWLVGWSDSDYIAAQHSWAWA